MNKERLQWALQLVCVFLFLISFSIAITVNFVPLYHLFVVQMHLGQRAGMSDVKLLHEYQRVLDFLNYPWISELHSAFQMSYNGLQHFYDVKNLFMFNYLILLCSAPLSFFFFRKLRRLGQQWRLIVPFQFFILGVIGLTGMMLLNFNNFFIYFHELLFRNNDWVFDPKLDPIINVLPDTFFLACFGLFFTLLIIFLVLGIFWGKQSLRKNR
ncbi:TIGR01906 family membrane protein [Liquorilactobacillus satsumensis]|uniref:Intergral membrane protein n=1 Tax=Liquorilactobacillus satsumensis DSM 16230 = JCM 12392 TaxID=1423801 RepID=A0A0R1VF84_9LACO|nr:TIGR01906 family membrane protein [Liquorilactobacillus satsumensis]KRM00540.1 intergral membrane protein [Liquorilactobacillus satsumensis DSM 16230 = JCM 12392]MCC7667407.1 TIGR01906 family membrane protein [Liquorilactobacillus satsumensis]MCP9313266.1 TIGR01906 family membrane protein [Liquorilactobacillus satsumensis]MCP9329518.1 TIGR01906 family membrane protein [Liquorilactobacillus satsumensis]MCP9358623.1 TIGR01906 family membrane protein [Liquorilactobacillus satsumensis]